MANPDVIITPGDGKIEFSGSSAGDSNSSKIRVGSNGDLHMEGSDLFVSGNLHVSGAFLTADGTSPDHISGLSGYFGKVGIGTTAMGTDALTVGALTNGITKTVQFNSEGGSEIGLKVMSRTNRATIKVGDNDTDAYIVAENGIRSFGAAGSASTSNLNILGGANAAHVGIGTTDPQRYLHIHSGDAGSVSPSTHSTAVIESSSHAALEFLSPNDKNAIIYMTSPGGYGYINYVGNAGPMNFSVGGSANMLSIDSDGNVGIGEETPEAKLQVNGDASITGELRVDDAVKIVADNGNQLSLDNDGDQWTQIDFANNGTNRTFLALDYTNHNFILGAQGGYSSLAAITFRPDGSNDDVVIHRAGEVGFRNRVDISGVLVGASTIDCTSLGVTTAVIHDGDSDTKITFDTDRIKLFGGGVELIDMREAGTNYVMIGGGDNDDVNFICKSQQAGTDFVLEVDAGSSTVGINCDPLDAKGAALVVSGDVSVTGQLKSHLGVGLKNGNSLHWDNENTRIIASHSSDYMNFDVGGYSEILHIEGDGRKVGIGGPWNTNPEATLQVSGDASISGELRTKTPLKVEAASPTSDAHYFRMSYDNSVGVLDANRGKMRLQANDGIIYTDGDSIGIGTSDPTTSLHINGALMVSGTANSTGIKVVGNEDLGIIIVGNDESHPTQSLAGARIIGPDSRRLYFELLGNDVTDHFRFLTSPNNDKAADHIALHIGNHGNVGIGTGTPHAKFTVNGEASISGELRIERYISHGGDTDTFLDFSSDRILTYAGNTVMIDAREAGTDYVAIGGVGDDPDVNLLVGSAAAGIDYVVEVDAGSSTVGINCDPLDAKGSALVVSGDVSVTGNLRASDYVQADRVYFTSFTSSLITNSSSILGLYGDAGISIRTYDGGWIERIGISDGGDVGIHGPNLTVSGDTSMTGSLHIGSAAFADAANDLSNPVLAIKQAGLSAEQGIYLERGGERKGYYIGIAGVDGLHFQRNFAGTKDDVMCLTRAGDVGIGTASPDSLLHLDGSAPTLTIEADGNTDDPTIILQRNDNAGLAARIQLDNSAGDVFFDNTYDHDNGDIFFRTKGTTKRVTIKGAGNVGIGTTSPDSLLHINTSSTSAGTDNFALRLQNPNTAADARVGIAFAVNAETSTNWDGAVIQATNNGVDGKGHLMFGAVENNTFTENIRFRSDGKVGIGTTNPAELLTVSGANATVRINTPTTTDSDTAMFSFGLNAAADLAGMKLDYTDRVASGLALFVHPAYGYPISLTPSTDKDILLNVLGDGKVGIGTTSPGSLLEVYENDSSAGNTQIHIHNDKTDDAAVLKLEGKRTSANDFAQLIFANNGNNGAVIQGRRVSSNDDGALAFFTSAPGTASVVTEAMRISNTGNIGIGTTNPNRQLTIYHATENVLLELHSDDADVTLSLRDGDAGGSAYVGIGGRGNDLKLVAGGTMKGTLESAGNFGIGTETPQAKLQVDGDASITGDTRIAGDVGIGAVPVQDLHVGGNGGVTSVDSHGRGFRVQDMNHAHGAIDIVQAGDQAQFISRSNVQGDFAFKSYASASSSLVERMRIDVDGKVGIGMNGLNGSFTPSGLLHIKGTNTAKIILENTDNATNMDIDYFNNGNAVVSRIRYSEGPGAFYFQPNTSSTALVILYNGHVGVGMSNPDTLFQVNGNASITGNIRVNGDFSNFQGEVSFSDEVTIQNDNAAKLRIFASNNDPYISFGDNSDNWAIGIDYSDSSRLKISNTSSVPGSNDKVVIAAEGVENIRCHASASGTTDSAAIIDVGSNNLDVDLIRVTSNTSGPRASSYYGGSLRYVGSRNDDGNSLSFFMHQAGDQQAKEMFSVSQYGKVLVGEGVGTNQGALFTVSGDASITGHLKTNSSSTFGGNISIPAGNLLYLDGGSNTYIYQDSADSISLATNSVIRWTADNGEFCVNDDSNDMDFRVESNGNDSMLFVDGGNNCVGIGTADPKTIFSITDGATPYTTANLLMQIKRNATNGNDDTSKASILMANNSNAMQIAYGGTTDRLRILDGGNVERFTLVNGGNIGIGTIAPDQLLHVNKGAAGGTTIVKTEVAANSTVGFEIKKTGGTTQNWRIVDGQTVNGVLEFYDVTNTATRIAIKGDGNVGVGITTPESTLQVNGDVGVTGAIRSNDNVFANNYFANNYLYHNGDVNSYLGFLSDDHIVFRTAGTDQVLIDDVGNTSITGELRANDKIVLGNTVGEGGHVRDIDFRRTNNSPNPTAKIRVLEPAATHTSAMTFSTSNASGGPNLIEALRITQAQKVGIGTSVPSAERVEIVAPSTDTTFNLNDQADSILVLRNSDSASTNNGRFCALQLKINSSSAAAESTIRTEFVGDGDARLIFSTSDGGTGGDHVHIQPDGSVYLDTIADFGSTSSASTKFLVSDSGYIEYLDGDEIIYDVTVTFSNATPSAGASTTVTVSVNGKSSSGGSPTLTLPSS